MRESIAEENQMLIQDQRLVDAIHYYLLNGTRDEIIAAGNAAVAHGPNVETYNILKAIYLNSDQDYSKRNVFESMLKIGDRDVVSETIIDALSGDVALEKNAAIRQCGDFMPDDRIIDLLSDALLDPDVEPWPLHGILRNHRHHLQDLIPSLDILAGREDEYALYTLGSIGVEANEALPEVAGILEKYKPFIESDSDFDRSYEMFNTVIAALGCIGLISDSTGDYSDIVLDYIENGNGEIKVQAINALCNMDDDGDIAIPILRRIVDSEPGTQQAIAASLRLYLYGVEKEKNYEAILASFETFDDWSVRIAVWATGYLGDDAIILLPRIREAAAWPGDCLYPYTSQGYLTQNILGNGYELTYDKPILVQHNDCRF